MRLDLTPKGFHAMVLTTEEGTVYIDTYSFGGGDIEHYISYYKKDFTPIAGKEMVCGVAGKSINTDNFNNSSNLSILIELSWNFLEKFDPQNPQNEKLVKRRYS